MLTNFKDCLSVEGGSNDLLVYSAVKNDTLEAALKKFELRMCEGGAD
jgi:hypothetical protein